MNIIRAFSSIRNPSGLRLISTRPSLLFPKIEKPAAAGNDEAKTKSGKGDDDEEFDRLYKYEFNKTLPVYKPGSILDKLKESFGLQGGYRHPQSLMSLASLRLYLCIQYQIDYNKLYQICHMPDVMYSFCLITFLHVWLVSIPLMQQGRSGLFVRKMLHKNMWRDIETRARKLRASMNRKNQLKTYNTLNGVFQAFMFGFDEGILSDDYVLAGAVWRHLFEMKELQEFEGVATMCEYIRKNVAHLDKINEADLLRHGIISFVDLDVKEVDHLKVRGKILEEILKKESS